MKMKNSIVISHTSRCVKSQDDAIAKNRNLTASDFVFWWDDNLMCPTLKINQSPFNLILFLCENKIITNPIVKNPFRLACLVYHKFIGIKEDTLQKCRDEFSNWIKDNHLLVNQFNLKQVCFDQYFKYDHYSCNKKIFGFLKSQGVSSSMISELISRGFLGYDEKYNNLVFIGKTMSEDKSIEKHGITSKHFMRLEGISYPFVYWLDRGEFYDPNDYYRIEVYKDTLTLLQHLSYLEHNLMIDPNVLYVSVHTENYNLETLSNLLEDYADVSLHFDFDDDRFTKSEMNPLEDCAHMPNEKIIEILNSIYNEEFSFKEIEDSTGLRVFESLNNTLYENGEECLPF